LDILLKLCQNFTAKFVGERLLGRGQHLEKLEAKYTGTFFRSHLKYANIVWSPYKQYLIEEVEKVQKRATKLVHGCKHLSYTERLKCLKLPTLKYRRHRGDMIETYKITHGLYDTAVAPSLMMSQVSHTRGNMYKLQKNFQV